jgi:predicted signal transduction protein with EAL and GGDEF domain
VGDAVLVQVAARLRDVVRSSDFLARVGGDEFFLRVDTDEAQDAAAIASRIMDAFAEPLLAIDDHYTRLTPSVGIAQVPYGTAASGKDLVREADLALYQAKNDGRATFSLFDPSMHENVSTRLPLADALRGALTRDEIDVVFQPIRSGTGYQGLTGWEVLVRWHSPEHGQVSPADFIPIAEDTGMIVDIGAYVLARACRQLVVWQQQADRGDLHVSVNVSSVQLLRDDVPALVARTLQETGLDPSCLWLEITESVVVERTDEALATLNALADLGVTLCMDDFGTGYSSLGYLKDFPLHVIKVDRSFVSNLVHDSRDRAVTKAIIEVAAALGMRDVVAEGVETAEQAAVLEGLGCSMVQGWHFGRPVPADQVVVPAAVRAGVA